MLIIYLLVGLITSIVEVPKFEKINSIPMYTTFLVYLIYISTWPIQIYQEYIRPKLGKVVQSKEEDTYY